MLTLICFEFHTTHSHTNTPMHTQTVWRKVGYLKTVTFICMQREEGARVSLYSKIAFRNLLEQDQYNNVLQVMQTNILLLLNSYLLVDS